MGDRLNIALVIERMLPQRGGRERSVAEVATELARRGHRVSVLCQEGDPLGEGVEVVPLRPGGLTRAGRLKRFVEAVGQAAGREAFDIVHATLPVPSANVYQPRGGTVPSQRRGRLRRCGPLGRLWLRLSGAFNPARRLAGNLERQVVARPDVPCLAVSQRVAEDLAADYGRRENVRVIYGGVDAPRVDDSVRAAWRMEWRTRWGAAEETCVFLVVAEDFALKGVRETVAAFGEHLRRSGREDLLVVAGGQRPAPYRRIARRAGAGERVIFTGHVAEAYPLYSAADAVVLLSWQDACSRVILEAIRWRLASLTTRFNGAAELLARGAGKVVESPRDRAAVVAAMDRLADPARRQEMSAACREIAEFVGIARHVDELEGIYREVARR